MQQQRCVIWGTGNQFVPPCSTDWLTHRPRPLHPPVRPSCWLSNQNTLLHSVGARALGGKVHPLFPDGELNYIVLVRVIPVDMNLCALTMRTHANVKDDRPFSGPIRSYVAPFKGLKGQRNTTSVTYHRSNFFQDDLDDPELAFDNNNTFRDECITPLLHYCTPTTSTTNLSIKIFGGCIMWKYFIGKLAR